MSYSTPLDKETKFSRFIGLFAGIICAFLTYYFFPSDAGSIAITQSGIKDLNTQAMPIVASVAILMGIWWMSEAIELPIAALLPLVLFSVFGADSFANISKSYASPIIFLFMGGFILALSIQKWNLHTRIALKIVLLTGTSPRKLIAGFMLSSAFLSMWVSNTATVVMILPVGFSILHIVSILMKEQTTSSVEEDLEDVKEISQQATQGGALNVVVHRGKDVIKKVQEKTTIYRTNFAICLMLGIAYAASIGSLGTIIGTPPNALLVGYMKNTFGIEIGFGQWMMVGVPLALAMLIFTWFLLTFVIFPLKIKEIPNGKEVIKQELDKLGPITTPEVLVSIIFLIAAFCWVFLGTILKNYDIVVKNIDSIIAISICVALFIIPVNGGKDRLTDWDTVKHLPWDILLLFGGGLAISSQFSSSGLSYWIGHYVAYFNFLPMIGIIILVSIIVTFLTEITSNTATAAAFLPVIGGVALGLGYSQNEILLFTIPVALSATCAFMLPVATPPNAIAYGSGYIKMADMIKAGFWLNILGSILITIATYFLVAFIFSINI